MAPLMSYLRDFSVDFVKLEIFDDVNFSGKKSNISLTTLNYVLTVPNSKENEDEPLANAKARQKCEQDDYIC